MRRGQFVVVATSEAPKQFWVDLFASALPPQATS
jgi:hypothetical protein